jgi:hypothetical protein
VQQIGGLRGIVKILLLLGFVVLSTSLSAQGYAVRAVDDTTGKSLSGIPITLRYACTSTRSGMKLTLHCKYLQRKTGPDGLAHFLEASSINDFDDIYSLAIVYGMTCCDISKPNILGTDVMKFHKRSFGEAMHWIFIGD